MFVFWTHLHRCQTFTISKRMVTNACDVAGNGDRGEASALVEGIFAYLGNRIGNSDACQTGTIREGTFLNGLNGCGDRDIFQVFTTIKQIFFKSI